MPRARQRAAFAGAILGICVGVTSLAVGDPSDPFSVALPGRDTQPPEGATGSAATTLENHVAEQTGAATFSLPIEVPPGRNGMVPRLSLDYSSNGELRRGFAAGWSMSVPTIERDPNADGVVYRLAMNGTSGILVEEPGDYGSSGYTRYRAELDETFARVALRNKEWTVSTPDGVVRTFAKLVGATDATTIWNLTSETDAFGNEIVYSWSTISNGGYVSYLLNTIEYTSNPGAGLGPNARVELTWVTPPHCSGETFYVGAQTDNHFGKKRMGARRLAEIKTSVRDTQAGAFRVVRTAALGYDATETACNLDRPALRFLTDVTVTAYDAGGAATVAPPVRFGYGPKTRSFGAPTTLSVSGIGEHGTRKGPESGLMDIDGDGIADQVRVAMPGANQTRCQLFWRKGEFGGTFAATERSTELPTARWDGLDGRPSQFDSCTLNGQFAWRASSVTQNPNELTCATSAIQESYHFIDWDHDGDLDLVTGQQMTGTGVFACGDFTCGLASQNNGGGGDNHGCPGGSIYVPPPEGVPEDQTIECSCPAGQGWDQQFGECRPPCGENETYNGSVCVAGCGAFETCTGFPEDPPGVPGGPTPLRACTAVNPAAEQGNKGYQWRVFRNIGGTFDPDPASLFGRLEFGAALPVPVNGGEMAPAIEGPPTLPSLVDIDGDGWLDLIKPTAMSLGSSTGIEVWRGGASGGGFTEGSTVWPKATWSQMPRDIEQVGGAWNLLTETSTAQLSDLNGDGLPDLVVNVNGSTTNLQVSYNMGGSFAPLKPMGTSAPVGRARLEQPAGWHAPMPLMQGWRGQEVSFVDLDADGLPEQLAMTTGSSVAAQATSRRATRFDGDSYLGLFDPGTAYESAEHLVTANTQLAATYATWYRTSDFIDITGDGLPDSVTFSATGQPTVRTDVAGDPLRLLTTIDNGRGAVTRFTYAMTTDPSVVTLGGGTTTPGWVVRRVTVTPGAQQPEMTAIYRYEMPQRGYTSDREAGPPHFLGYAKVTKELSGQLGAQSSRRVELYSYSTGHDHRGHVVQSWTYGAGPGGTWQPATTTTTGWTYATLLDGKVGFSYPAVTTTRTCASGSTEAQCAAELQDAITTRQTYTSWNGPSGTVALMYQNVETSVEWPRADGQLQKLVTARTFNTRMGQSPYATTDYRVLPLVEEQRAVSPQGAITTVARTTTTRDAAGLPAETAVGMSSIVTARTTRTFDATGNVLTVRRPSQTAINGTLVTTYTYDPHQLFALQTTNELGHRVLERHDFGTGAVVYREGPNSRSVQVDPRCRPRPALPCATTTVYEPEYFIVDGFGRVIEHRVAVDPAAGPSAGYAIAPIQWTTFNDSIVPNQRRTDTVRDFGGATNLVAEDTYDGLGRLVRHEEKRAVAPHAVTSYEYDAGGALHLLSKTDPRVDNGAMVTTTFTRDGLGRVTALARPDGTQELVRYAGLDVTTQPLSPVEGYGAATTLEKDARGRLERVIELDSAMGMFPASTFYTYDVLGRMTTMLDGDDNETSLEHDWMGHRTKVIRGAREWRYGYNLDGNQISVIAPKPFGATDADYTSLSTFDAIGRPLVHTPAPRGLSPQRRAALYIGPTTTEYDVGANAIGRASRVVFPGGTISNVYDVRGLPAQERLDIALGSTLTASQVVDRTYNALGSPTSETWDDGSTWRTGYDERGLVTGVEWKDPANGQYRAVASYTRSVAGAPRERGTYFDQRRAWQYDALGRVIYDRVYRTSTGASWAERSYGFDGFGRLGAISGAVDGQIADAVFEHDGRGRITRADGPGHYTGVFEYSPAGNVMRATVSGAADVPDRDVSYSYGEVDPQAVDYLADVRSGELVAQLGYDASGNVATRSVRGGDYALTSDGDDQLREVNGPDGSEIYVFAGPARRIAAISDTGVKVWFGASEAHYSTIAGHALRWLHISAGEVLARVQNRTMLELQYADALQNLVLSLSPTGAVAASFVYGAFGEVVASSGEANHRRAFNGKESDEVSGLRFYGYRSYDPLLLRWTSGDPLYRFAPDAAWAEPQRANLYAFSLNNPLRYYDPDGRNPEEDDDIEEGAPWASKIAVFLFMPDSNDGAGKTALKIGGIIILGIPVAVFALGEFAVRDAINFMGLPIQHAIGDFFRQIAEVQTADDPGEESTERSGERSAETWNKTQPPPYVPLVPRKAPKKPKHHAEAKATPKVTPTPPTTANNGMRDDCSTRGCTHGEP